jgi:hypothetical protein
MNFYVTRNEKDLHCRFCHNKKNLFELFPYKGIVCSHCMEQLDDIISQIEKKTKVIEE